MDAAGANEKKKRGGKNSGFSKYYYRDCACHVGETPRDENRGLRKYASEENLPEKRIARENQTSYRKRQVKKNLVKASNGGEGETKKIRGHPAPRFEKKNEKKKKRG